LILDFSSPFLVDQKFPNCNHDKHGQSDTVPDHSGVADFVLFEHAHCVWPLVSRGAED
jgi:hypothetical protein